jgi:hypothetical protein
MNSEERELDTPSSEESNIHSGYESAESNRLVICAAQNVMGCDKSLYASAFVKMVGRGSQDLRKNISKCCKNMPFKMSGTHMGLGEFLRCFE